MKTLEQKLKALQKSLEKPLPPVSKVAAEYFMKGKNLGKSLTHQTTAT